MKTDRRKYSKLYGLHNDRNDRNIGPSQTNALNHFYICLAEDVTTTITTIHKDH